MDDHATRDGQLAQADSQLGGVNRPSIRLDDAGIGRRRSGALLDLLGRQQPEPLGADRLGHGNSACPGAFLRNRARGPQPPVEPQIHIDGPLPLQLVQLGDRIRRIGAKLACLVDTDDGTDLIQLGIPRMNLSAIASRGSGPAKIRLKHDDARLRRECTDMQRCP